MDFLKKGQNIRAWVDPPPPYPGNARKKTFFFVLMSSLIYICIIYKPFKVFGRNDPLVHKGRRLVNCPYSLIISNKLLVCLLLAFPLTTTSVNITTIATLALETKKTRNKPTFSIKAPKICEKTLRKIAKPGEKRLKLSSAPKD